MMPDWIYAALLLAILALVILLVGGNYERLFNSIN